MQIKEVTSYLETLAPRSSQESYDNSGLLVGNASTEITGVLICLDSIESVVDEAKAKGCNLIIAHHPIIFKGLKSLTGKNYIERTILSCIKNDIALYAIHTNLDNYKFGVNQEIGKRLGLENLRILSPKESVLSKIVTYVPQDQVEQVRKAMFNAGAGNIGNYSECSFSVEGSGTFKPGNEANPFSGEIGKRSSEKEYRLEVLVSNHIVNNVLHAMKSAHPYEEVAYEIYSISNHNQDEGAGMIGELPEEMNMNDYLCKVKANFNCGTIRHTALITEKVKRVAFCGGSGSFLLKNAISSNADLYITGDFKYHEFFDADNQIVIADIGHYESEQYTINLIADILTKKFTKFAVHLTGVNTNPINYL